MIRKGIILAGGNGTRLYPLTKSLSKHLLPVYDKPMIYYSTSVLMMMGIRELLILTRPEDIDLYKNLLGDGSDFGVSIEYLAQPSAGGLPEAFIIGEDFIGDDNVALILGDNIFYGTGFAEVMKETSQSENGATVFAYKVKDPKRFGVIDFDEDLKALSIEEKPEVPKSDYAVTGLYFYDNNVVSFSKKLKRSSRGELEITDLNNMYLAEKSLNVKLLGRGFAWLDAGTYDSLIEASQFVKTIEHRQGLKIACLEEIAYLNKWISKEEIIEKAARMSDNSYKKYLMGLFNEK